jgi:hypothetical protein
VTAKPKIQFYVDADDAAKLRVVADALGVSQNAVLSMMVKQVFQGHGLEFSEFVGKFVSKKVRDG